jgi:asparagine synthase (glutamine-hydrolysing)
LLTDSVRLQLRSDVEVGSCLSGGLDSSSIVCLAHLLLQQQGQTKVQHTFSSHFEEEEANELEYTQEAIQATGVQAHFVYPTPEQLLQDLERLVWHQEEPFGSTSIFAQWSVFKLVNQHGIKVMLDGQGSDEMLAGYVGFVPLFFQELAAKKKTYRLLWETWRNSRLNGSPWLSLLHGRLGDKLRALTGYRNTVKSYPPQDWISPELGEKYRGQSRFLANQEILYFGALEHLNNLLYQQTFYNNLQQLLKYEDRDSMAFSVEARVPFLDHRLVEFIFSLPSTFKVRDGYTKRVLRDGMAGVLPEKIRWRVNKLGFATPERAWQRTVLRPLIEQAVYDDRLRPYLIPEKALAYLSRLDSDDLLDFTPWRWVNLSLWMKAYGLG